MAMSHHMALKPRTSARRRGSGRGWYRPRDCGPDACPLRCVFPVGECPDSTRSIGNTSLVYWIGRNGSPSDGRFARPLGELMTVTIAPRPRPRPSLMHWSDTRVAAHGSVHSEEMSRG